MSGYRVRALDPDGWHVVFSAMDTVDQAVDFALSLRKNGITPVRVDGPEGVALTQEELEVAMKDKPSRKRGR